MGDAWGSDAPVSMPEPPSDEQPLMVELGSGFCMTTGGIAHNITQNTVEELSRPSYAPTGNQ